MLKSSDAPYSLSSRDPIAKFILCWFSMDVFIWSANRRYLAEIIAIFIAVWTRVQILRGPTS